MAQTVGTGSVSYVRYGYEATYNTSPGDGSLDTYFGHNVKFSATPKNNIERIPDFNTRNFTSYAAKKFEGTFTVDFQVSNFWFMKGLIGTPATTGSGPYTHTYTENNLPASATIQSSEELGDTDSERTFTGCVFDKLTLNMNTGDVITGKIDGFYAKEVKDSTLNATGNAQDTEDVFTFAQASLEYPNATVKNRVQSLDYTLSNNAELIWGLGSRLATARAHKTRVHEFRMSRIREADADILDSFYGSTTTLEDPGTPANVASLDLIISNGDTSPSTDERTFQALFDNLQFEDPSIPLNPAEVTKEDVTMYCLNFNSSTKPYYKNNTATHP